MFTDSGISKLGGEYLNPNPTVRAKMFTDSGISKLGVSTSTPTQQSEPRCSLTPASPNWGWVPLPQPHRQSQDVHWRRHLQTGGEYLYPNPTVRAKMFTDSDISKLGVSTSTPTPQSEPRCLLTLASPSWGWVHLPQPHSQSQDVYWLRHLQTGAEYICPKPIVRAKMFTDISKLGVSSTL